MKTDASTDSERMLEKEHEKPERSGLFQSCQWFKENPLRRYQFAVFLLFGILTLLWLILRVTSSLTGDALSGLCALVLAGYGAQHFRILLGLKEQVDKYARYNRQFKSENSQLVGEVNRLERAQTELGDAADALKQTTEGYRENISRFKALDEKLGKLADDNIAGLEKLREMSATVQDSIQKELVQHERDILSKVQETMEFGDDVEGMNEEEFNRFVAALPRSFQVRFEKMGQSFDDMAGDDRLLDLDEFTRIADQFAQQIAASGGS